MRFDEENGPPEDLTLDAFRGTWDHSWLPDNIRLGADCFIESPRLLVNFGSKRQPGLVLGNGVRLCLGGWGGQLSVSVDGLIEIGDRSLLVGVQMMCKERITIGADVSISYNVVIADSDYHPRDPDLRRADAISGAPYGVFTGRSEVGSLPVNVEDGASIGINAIILKGVRIGAGARVLPGAVVTRDVPAGATVSGNPSRLVNAEW